jgi:hypothetical protein
MTENRQLYDEMCRVLTDYEGNGSEEGAAANDLYDVLVKIQNRWEYLVTSSTGSRGILADWLAGAGPYMCKVKGLNFIIIRLRKNADFDYLYTQRQYNNDHIERGNKFEYAGLYCRRNGLVYDCPYSVRDLFDEPGIQDARSEEALLEYLKAAEELRSDCTCYYSDWNIVAADRKEFERLFGRGAHYGPKDILRIEYARSVLYENETAGTSGGGRDTKRKNSGATGC